MKELAESIKKLCVATGAVASAISLSNLLLSAVAKIESLEKTVTRMNDVVSRAEHWSSERIQGDMDYDELELMKAVWRFNGDRTEPCEGCDGDCGEPCAPTTAAAAIAAIDKRIASKHKESGK